MTPKFLTAALAFSLCTVASASEWGTSVPKAVAQAKTEKKLAFLDFTGSDWCGWCIKLKQEIFDTPEFKAYAATNLVLVELDFPKKKEIAPALKAENNKLAKEYGIQGFPTIIVLDGTGKQVGKLGYMPGGPKAFIAELEKLKK